MSVTEYPYAHASTKVLTTSLVIPLDYQSTSRESSNAVVVINGSYNSK